MLSEALLLSRLSLLLLLLLLLLRLLLLLLLHHGVLSGKLLVVRLLLQLLLLLHLLLHRLRLCGSKAVCLRLSLLVGQDVLRLVRAGELAWLKVPSHRHVLLLSELLQPCQCLLCNQQEISTLVKGN